MSRLKVSEPGIERVPRKSGDEITEILVNSIIRDTNYSRIVREWDDKIGWVDLELLNKPLQKEVFGMLLMLGILFTVTTLLEVELTPF